MKYLTNVINKEYFIKQFYLVYLITIQSYKLFLNDILYENNKISLYIAI